MNKNIIFFSILNYFFVNQTVFPDIESRVSDLENQMDQVFIVTPNETCGATTALARPILDGCDACCGTNWWIDLALIYWHPKIGGTEYAYTDELGDQNFLGHGEIKRIGFNWDYGIKAGVGYNFFHDGWDLYGEYIRLKSKASDNVSVGGDNLVSPGVIPLQGSPRIPDVGIFTLCKRARTHFETYFQEVILELGRSFYVSEWLSLHPSFGLMGTIFDLEQTIRYSGGSDIGNNEVRVFRKCDFWGVGPSLAMNGAFHLNKDFSLFGDFRTALTYGEYDTRFKQAFSLSSIESKMNLSYHTLVPTIQLQIGVQYDKYFCSCNEQKHIELQLGFETQYWFGMNQMLESYTATSIVECTAGVIDRFHFANQNINFHGITLKGRLDF